MTGGNMERMRGRVRRSGREVIGGGRQGGLTLGGLLVAGFLIIVAAIVGMKIVPTVIEYYSLDDFQRIAECLGMAGNE